MDQPEPQMPAREEVVPETGHHLGGPFLAFYEHYGPTLCGYPITDVVMEDGVPCQYFQCLALEEHIPGRVRLKPLGEAWLATAATRGPATETPAPPMGDIAARLPRHPHLTYATRPLADIRYLVIHHTGAAPDVGAVAIATEHVETNGWPGIGYHYVVGADGAIQRTQDLTVVSYHARQFNPAAVGIALAGDFGQALPPARQLEATAELLAGLLADLGLPPEAVRGHREMVPTACPGELFLGTWKPALMRAVAERLAPASPVAR
jgi:hypothetical protein